MIPEPIRYLLGSDERVRLLEALRDGPTRQCALRRDCSLARSTVHRNLEGCEARNWVVETDDGYVLTQVGEQLLDAFRRFEGAVSTIGAHEPVLERLHGVDESLPRRALQDCHTTSTEENDPHAPSIAAADVIRRNAGNRIRIAVSGISPITNDAGWSALAGGSDLETLVDERVYETLRRSYDGTVERAVDHERFELFVSSSPIETGLVLAGTDVCVIVHDDVGNAQATLTGSNQALRDWAEGVYGRLREESTPIEREPPAVAPND